MENMEFKKPISISDLYENNLIIKEESNGISIGENGELILDKKLEGDGWKMGIQFSDNDNPERISSAIEGFKQTGNEVAIVLLKNDIRILIYKEKKV